jgi:ATPase subunit of ABC transporter with duplicated ATPase domains
MQFGDRVLYSNVNLKLKTGNRYGLIGGNGSGKTTLIKILQGEEVQTDGNIEFEPGRTRGYLRQDHNSFDGFSILDTVLQGHARFWEVHKQRETLYAKSEMTEEEGILVSELEMEFADLDGYMAEARAGELLEGLGIPTEQHNDPLTSLVGGWKLRVLLAQALFARPDILMLDEPTNHLDIHTISWLEKMLNQYEGMVVVISHDRHFLDNVCTHILDVDYKEINQFTGNYSQWETAVKQARERAQATTTGCRRRRKSCRTSWPASRPMHRRHRRQARARSSWRRSRKTWSSCAPARAWRRVRFSRSRSPAAARL